MQAVKNLKICTLTGSISPKLKDLDEKLQKNYVSWHWRVMQNAKFEEKLTLGSINNMRNLVNFDASSGKSENLHSDVLLLLITFVNSI